MPKKRRRRKLRLEAWLWLALIANVALGIEFSPITSPTKATLFGVAPWDMPRTTVVMNDLQDKAWSRIDPRQVETALMSASAVDDAVFQRNVFGRVSVKISYRTPVGRLGGRLGVALDSRGVVYRTQQDLSKLPELVLPVDREEANLTLQSSWQSERIAELCQAIPIRLRGKPVQVLVTSRGGVSLVPEGAGVVNLGSPDDLRVKLDRLDELLRQNPDLLVHVKSLNLTAPDRPVQRP